MSYLVLARKSRPQTFAEVVGQKPVVQTLQNSLERDRVAHAILFSGVRGVGKTTLARLMAKALNCQEGPTPTPCNQCLSCRQIVAGAALDLHEIDGASNRGIQEVRELKEKIKFMPTSSRYKVIIIDEVHMLTGEAFNALLKTLEEPPAHVYFMFATTELHKIPITILSRCQRYELRRVGSEELRQHFSKLAAAEGIEIENGALNLIVREAEGSVRDGLSLLDQVFSYGESPITVTDVVEVLGLVDRDILHQISRALLEGDRPSALGRLSETFSFGMDGKRFMADLLERFRSLLLLKIDGCESLLDLGEEDLGPLRELARDFSLESIHHKLNLLMRAAEELRYSSQPRLALETAFLSIIEAGNVVPVADLLSRLDQALDALPPRGGIEDQENQGSGDEPAKKKIAENAAKSPDASPSPPTPPPDSEVPVPEEQPPWALEEPPPPPEPADAGETPDTAEDQEASGEPAQKRPPSIESEWPALVAYVKQQKPGMGHNLEQAQTIRHEGGTLVLEYRDPTGYTLLDNLESRTLLSSYIKDFLGISCTVKFLSPGPSPGSTDTSAEPKALRQKIAAHPVIQMTEEILGGQVRDIRLSGKNH